MAGSNETGDLLMFVAKTQSSLISGEGMSDLTPMSEMLSGFKVGKFFEISSFQFSIETMKKDENAKNLALFAKHLGAQFGAGIPAALKQAPLKPIDVKVADTAEPESCPIQPVSFSRPIDKGSPELMQLCIDSTTVYGAVVVKRKPAGGKAAGEAYLRFEFRGVLFTDVSWDNGESVTEKCSFITRAVTVKYRPQLPDGSLGAIKSGSWSRLPTQPATVNVV